MLLYTFIEEYTRKSDPFLNNNPYLRNVVLLSNDNPPVSCVQKLEWWLQHSLVVLSNPFPRYHDTLWLPVWYHHHHKASPRKSHTCAFVGLKKWKITCVWPQWRENRQSVVLVGALVESLSFQKVCQTSERRFLFLGGSYSWCIFICSNRSE